jgi:hypothetical protein
VPSYLGWHTILSSDANSLIVGYQRRSRVPILGRHFLFSYGFTLAPEMYPGVELLGVAPKS